MSLLQAKCDHQHSGTEEILVRVVVSFNPRGVFAALVAFLLIVCFYLVEEYHEEEYIILIGFGTAVIVTGIIAAAVFRISYHHVCPLCNGDIGKRGDVVSRQLIVPLFSVCFHFPDSMEKRQYDAVEKDAEDDGKRIHRRRCERSVMA